MNDSFIGEIRRFAFQTIPEHWLPCDGRLLPIGGYQALFSLVGNMYGGDAINNFALPDLRGRTPVQQNGAAGYLGQTAVGPGPSQPFQTVTYAILTQGVFPTRP